LGTGEVLPVSPQILTAIKCCFSAVLVAKRDFTRVRSLQEHWESASLAEKEQFVVWVGQQIANDVAEATQSLFSMPTIAADHAQPATHQHPQLSQGHSYRKAA
jgi:hypothetical protein